MNSYFVEAPRDCPQDIPKTFLNYVSIHREVSAYYSKDVGPSARLLILPVWSSTLNRNFFFLNRLLSLYIKTPITNSPLCDKWGN